MDNINYYMYYWASQVVLVIKNLSANAEDVIRDVGLIPGPGISCGGGHSNPLQYSCLAHTWIFSTSHYLTTTSNNMLNLLQIQLPSYTPWDSQVAPEVKNLPVNVGDGDSIPGWGRSPDGGNGNPLQYSRLENPMDRETWHAIVRGVAKGQTRLRIWAHS